MLFTLVIALTNYYINDVGTNLAIVILKIAFLPIL